jgi:hypothetical protein
MVLSLRLFSSESFIPRQRQDGVGGTRSQEEAREPLKNSELYGR